MKVNVINLQKRIAVGQEKIKKIIRAVLRLEKVRKNGEITVSLVTDAAIKELNTVYMGRYCSTDVLSFDISRSRNELITDIAISTDTALQNAKRYHTSALFEVYLYVIHGLLHVLGYDDANQKKRKKMQYRTESILAYLKIKKNGN